VHLLAHYIQFPYFCLGTVSIRNYLWPDKNTTTGPVAFLVTDR
jgi:hypothetical protein